MDEVRRLISGAQKVHSGALLSVPGCIRMLSGSMSSEETDEGSCQPGEETPSSRRRQEQALVAITALREVSCPAQALHEDADTHEANTCFPPVPCNMLWMWLPGTRPGKKHWLSGALPTCKLRSWKLCF